MYPLIHVLEVMDQVIEVMVTLIRLFDTDVYSLFPYGGCN